MSEVSNPVSHPQLLLSLAETARALGVSRVTVYKLIDSGDLPDVHVGRRRVFPAQAVQEFVDNLAHSARLNMARAKKGAAA